MDNRSVPDALKRIQEVRAAREAALAAVRAAETPAAPAEPATPAEPAAPAPEPATPIEPVVEAPSPPGDAGADSQPPPPPRTPEALPDDELVALAEALGVGAPPALVTQVERELERRELWRPLALLRGEMPGVPSALVDGVIAPLRHFGTTLGLVARHVLVAIGIALTVAVLYKFELSPMAIAIVVAFAWGSTILRLYFADVRFTADAGRGRPTTSVLGPRERTGDVWLALLFFELAPRTVAGEAMRPFQGTTFGQVLDPILGLAWWTALGVAMLGVVDLGISPIAAAEAQVRASRGRRLALLAFVLAHLALLKAPLAWIAATYVFPNNQPVLQLLATIRDVLLSIGAFLVFLFGLGRLHAGWASRAAREAAPTASRFMLSGGAPGTWRSQVAGLILLIMVFRGPLAEWFQRMQTELPGSVWTTIVLVPLLVAGLLLLGDHLQGRRIDADDAGLLLDPGPRWPGTRVAWKDVHGYRHIDGAVQLVVVGLPGLLGPRVPVANDEERAAVGALLESRGVRADA